MRRAGVRAPLEHYLDHCHCCSVGSGFTAVACLSRLARIPDSCGPVTAKRIAPKQVLDKIDAGRLIENGDRSQGHSQGGDFRVGYVDQLLLARKRCADRGVICWSFFTRVKQNEVLHSNAGLADLFSSRQWWLLAILSINSRLRLPCQLFRVVFLSQPVEVSECNDGNFTVQISSAN